MKNIVKDSELENVTGGWQYANGTYVNYGSYIMYTGAAGTTSRTPTSSAPARCWRSTRASCAE